MIARNLSRGLRAPLLYAKISRLLVDLNRSANNGSVFSEFSRGIEEDLLTVYHQPYRAKLKRTVISLSRKHTVLHFSVHSFTPVLRGRRRQVEIGILFDPQRSLERRLAAQLQKNLKAVFPRWRIRLNSPYRGDGDGLTTHLRTLLPQDAYSGIELEFNCRILPALDLRKLRGAVAALA